MLYIFGIILGYLLGSVPMGLLVTRFSGHGDLRQVGSGNIGATNVMRVGGLRLAGLVWLLDMTKAVLAVLIGYAIGGDVFAGWCGFATVVGHCFPIWLKFHGGKGVSCLFGVILALNPLMFVICGIEWLVVALISGYSSLGALTVFVVAPLLGFASNWSIGFALLGICLLCVWRHMENIGRLVGGTESKIKWKWKK
jgi:glycerol-3-phosphate acyltransferase PlsY